MKRLKSFAYKIKDHFKAHQDHIRHSMLLSFGNYGGSFLDMATLAIIARHVAVSEFGILMVVMAIAFLVFQVLELGLSAETTRVVARQSAEDTLSRLWTLRFCLSLAGWGLLSAIGLIWHRSIGAAVLAGFGLAYACEYLSEWAIAVLRGRERFDQEAWLNVLGKLVLLAFVFVLWQSGRVFSLIAVSSAFIVANGLKMAAALLVSRQRIAYGWQASGRLWRQHLLRASPLGLANLLTQAILRIDLFLVMSMLGAAMAGAYGAALTLSNGLAVVWSATLLTYFPKFFSDFKESPEAFRMRWRSCWRNTVLLTGGCALILFWPFPYLMGLVYGPAYHMSGFSRWFLLSSMGAALPSVAGMGLTTLSSSHIIARAHAEVLILSVALNILLIKAFGLQGAAAAAALTHLAKAWRVRACFLRQFEQVIPKKQKAPALDEVAAETVQGGSLW